MEILHLWLRIKMLNKVKLLESSEILPLNKEKNGI